MLVQQLAHKTWPGEKEKKKEKHARQDYFLE